MFLLQDAFIESITVLVCEGASPEHDPLASGKPNEPICVKGLPCGEEAVLEAG